MTLPRLSHLPWLLLALVACSSDGTSNESFTPNSDGGTAGSAGTAGEQGGLGGGGSAGDNPGGAGAGGNEPGGAAGEAGQAGQGSAGGAGGGPARCKIAMCFTGAIDQKSGSNNKISDLCDDPLMPDLIPDCDSGTCYSTHDSFDMFSGDALPRLLEAFIHGLDTNQNGRVDPQDKDCEVSLVAFSWGAIHAVEMAQAFMTDQRVDPSRRTIDKLLVMETFQRGLTGVVDPPIIPANVKMTRSFRRSIVPASGDCSSSATAIGGPYVGLPPLCAASMDCRDYDYSLAPETFFPGANSELGFYGKDVDHCSVPYVAHKAVRSILNDQAPGLLPPEVPVRSP